MLTRRLACLFTFLTLLVYSQGVHTLWAAPPRQIVTVQGTTLHGELPYQYNATTWAWPRSFATILSR